MTIRLESAPAVATTVRQGLRSHRTAVAAVALGVLAVVISAVGSGTASLWGDEAASLLAAERPLPSLATMVQNVDAVHALYYLGLHGWIALAGTSPVALRFPSAVAIGVAVSGLVLLGQRLRTLRFGILAGLIGATLPRLTDVGSEARSYAFTAAIAVGLTLLIVHQLQARAPRTHTWVAYGALLALGTTLFLWLALVALAHLLVVAVVRRELVRRHSVALVTAMAIASPVLLLAYLERHQIAYLSSRQLYDANALLVAPWFENTSVALAVWPLVVAGTVMSIGSWLRSRGDPRGAPRGGSALIAVVWLILPTVALIGGSALVAIFTPRYLAMCAPAVALLTAMPLDALLGRFAATRRPTPLVFASGAMLLVIALIAPVWVAQRQPYAKNESDWAAISTAMSGLARPGDAVAFDDTVRPSRRPRLALRTYPAGFAGLHDITLKTPFTSSPTWYDLTYSLAEARALGRLDGVTRIWLVEYAQPTQVDDAGVATLKAAGFTLRSSHRLHRSEIQEFVRG